MLIEKCLRVRGKLPRYMCAILMQGEVCLSTILGLFSLFLYTVWSSNRCVTKARRRYNLAGRNLYTSRQLIRALPRDLYQLIFHMTHDVVDS